MKKLIEDTGQSCRTIIGQVLKGVSSNEIAPIGSQEALSKMLRRHRNVVFNPAPYLYSALKLSRILSISHTGEVFYQYGVQNFRNLIEYDNFLIFYTQTMIEKLKCEDIYCVDGTFSVVPRPYTQLFLVSFLKNATFFQ
jgi:hypothetical protein